MVSILPAGRTPFDVIGADVGRALQSVMPQAMQQMGQRQMGLNAIDQLQKELADAKGDYSKSAAALMKAYTLNPALERSGIAERVLQQTQMKAGTQEPLGKPRGPVKTEEGGGETPISVGDIVPQRPSLVQDPTGVTNFQLPYGPDEISAIRQESRKRGYLPEIEERFVKDALEYNQVAEQRRNAEIANYAQQQQQRRDTLENQQLFEKYMGEHDPEFASNPDEMELALKASQKYQNEPSFAERNAKVKNEIRPYQAAKQALKKTLNRPLFGQTAEQRELARPRAQTMVEMGQKPQLQLMIAQGGMGEVEEADLLNPLSKEFEGRLNKFNRFVDPLSAVTNIDPESKEYAEQLLSGQKRLEKQKELMTDTLAREIKSGTYDKPGTNLILIRYHLMNKGLSWDDAGLMIDQAIQKGKVKLDPQQKIDFQKLGYPPLTGETYFDTVMNNVLFPITGKQ